MGMIQGNNVPFPFALVKIGISTFDEKSNPVWRSVIGCVCRNRRLATFGAGEGNLTLGESTGILPLFCHSEGSTCLKTGFWHNAAPTAETAELGRF
jgi:hypothetical protein